MQYIQSCQAIVVCESILDGLAPVRNFVLVYVELFTLYLLRRSCKNIKNKKSFIGIGCQIKTAVHVSHILRKAGEGILLVLATTSLYNLLCCSSESGTFDGGA